MTTDLPALDTYDAELSDIARRYDPSISAAFLATEAAREALADAEREHTALLEGRALEVHQARVRFLDETRTEIVDGQLRARRGRPPTKRAEAPALISPTPDLTNPNVIGAMAALVPTPEPILANLVSDAERGLAAMASEAPVGRADGESGGTAARADGESEAPTAADAFIDAVSEPERSLYEQGFSRAEVAATPIAEQWRLKRENVNHIDVHQIDGGMWIEPGAAVSAAGEDCPF